MNTGFIENICANALVNNKIKGASTSCDGRTVFLSDKLCAVEYEEGDRYRCTILSVDESEVHWIYPFSARRESKEALTVKDIFTAMYVYGMYHGIFEVMEPVSGNRLEENLLIHHNEYIIGN